MGDFCWQTHAPLAPALPVTFEEEGLRNMVLANVGDGSAPALHRQAFMELPRTIWDLRRAEPHLKSVAGERAGLQAAVEHLPALNTACFWDDHAVPLQASRLRDPSLWSCHIQSITHQRPFQCKSTQIDHKDCPANHSPISPILEKYFSWKAGLSK